METKSKETRNIIHAYENLIPTFGRFLRSATAMTHSYPSKSAKSRD